MSWSGRTGATARDGRWLGVRTARHLPLSLGVQAALEVLALPTQEKCDTLQPSQAKLSQASFVGFSASTSSTLFSICFSGYNCEKWPSVSDCRLRWALAADAAHALSYQLMQSWLRRTVSACYNTQPNDRVPFLWLYWFGQVWKVLVPGRKKCQILWIKAEKRAAAASGSVWQDEELARFR